MATDESSRNSELPIYFREEKIAMPEQQIVSKQPQFVSVTDLSSYLYCPRALYQQKVLGYPEKLNEAMVLGAIRHSFYDQANKQEENIVVSLPAGLSKESIISAYSDTYGSLISEVAISHSKSLAVFDLDAEQIAKKLQPIALAEAAERAANLYSFYSQNNMLGEELWQLLTPKILTEMKVKSETLRLKGVVDRVEVHKNTVLPIELKTGKMARDGVWPSHRIQVAAYMLLLQEKFNMAVGQAVIRYLDHQSSKVVNLNPYMELEVKETTEKVIRLLGNEAVPKQCGRENCSCAR